AARRGAGDGRRAPGRDARLGLGVTRRRERPTTASDPLPGTERRNPKAAGLAAMSTLEIVTLMNDEDATVPAAVRAVLPDIARAADAIAAAFASGGRLRYVGAGTSRRRGVLDASEAPPTFGVEPDGVHGVIAGGDAALRGASTAAMIRGGRTKGDLMIDVRPTNAKLRKRAIRMVRDELGIDEDAAVAKLEASGWSVRRAIAAR